MQNVECRMQNVECRMQNAECRMQNAECRMFAEPQNPKSYQDLQDLQNFRIIAIGRPTVYLLSINLPERVELRRTLMSIGVSFL